jgi:hypothetical protein
VLASVYAWSKNWLGAARFLMILQPLLLRAFERTPLNTRLLAIRCWIWLAGPCWILWGATSMPVGSISMSCIRWQIRSEVVSAFRWFTPLLEGSQVRCPMAYPRWHHAWGGLTLRALHPSNSFSKMLPFHPCWGIQLLLASCHLLCAPHHHLVGHAGFRRCRLSVSKHLLCRAGFKRRPCCR